MPHSAHLLVSNMHRSFIFNKTISYLFIRICFPLSLLYTRCYRGKFLSWERAWVRNKGETLSMIHNWYLANLHYDLICKRRYIDALICSIWKHETAKAYILLGSSHWKVNDAELVDACHKIHHYNIMSCIVIISYFIIFHVWKTDCSCWRASPSLGPLLSWGHLEVRGTVRFLYSLLMLAFLHIP